MIEAAASEASLATQVRRLERRVERERTARQEAEAIAEEGLRALYEANRDLDRRVRERVVEIETLAERVARAERVKSEILATVSHELRTPLMAVIGALDLMEEGGWDDEDGHRIALAGAYRLRELVDELFAAVDLAHDAQAFREPVDLVDFLEALAVTWRFPALQQGSLLVTSVAAETPEVAVDRARTRTALDRLVGNAIEHAPGGTISVIASATPTAVEFVVADQGPGMDQGRVAELLEPFEMGDRTSTRSSRGMGLGLALAKGLIELQDGSLHIESSPGVGTRVTVSLPLTTPEAADPTTEPSTLPPE
ncbi:MAG: HAMP domain-containing sensor histidine kinase [Actinomycetota bacterium]